MGYGVDGSTVRVEPRPCCFLCGKKGNPLYKGMKDRLFSAPGVWSLSQCPDHECGLIWLDPMPVKEDLGKLYLDYMTHSEPPVINNKKNILEPIFYFLHYLTLGPWRVNRDACLYLDKEKPGKLLEIGCGSGDRLKHMCSLGWEGVGVEVDPVARAIAEEKSGCKVYAQDLKEIKFPDNFFDAVIMSHVIEHVNDPEGLLKECLRLLKPGGKFVATTPNALSLGHWYFKYCWMQLDPPRHLHIFSTRSIRKLAQLIGVDARVSTQTLHVDLMAAWSFKFRDGLSAVVSLNVSQRNYRAILFKLWEWFVYVFDRKAGESIVFTIVKP